jgi:hypothetical protein
LAGACGVTTVAYEDADADPSAFVPVTFTRVRLPRSPETGVYDDDVAPEMFEQLESTPFAVVPAA